jgi:hypothetical protein
VFFQLRDYFGQVATSVKLGSGVLVKLSPDIRNIGQPAVAVSSVGLVQATRIEFGGKAGTTYSWKTAATWFRPDYVPGKVLRFDAPVTINALTTKCIPGEITVYDFDPLMIKQAKQRGEKWKNVIKRCVWCEAGNYAVTSGVTACTGCSDIPTGFTVGANCLGGGNYILPKKNFWRTGETRYLDKANYGDYIYKCPKIAACPGGQGNLTIMSDGTEGYGATPCATGYTGPLCAVCDNNYGNAGKTCVKCGGLMINGDVISFIIIVLLVVIVLSKALYDKWFNGGDMKGTKALKILMKKQKIAARGKAIVGQVKILIAYFQTLLAFIMGGDTQFPTSFSQLMDSFEFCNVDIVAIINGMCLVSTSFYGIFLYNFLMPMIFTLLVLMHYFITKPRGAAAEEDSAKNFGSFHWTLFCMMCFFIYPNGSRVMISMFRCHELQFANGVTKSYLYADYSIQCYEGDHVTYMILGAIGVLLYPVGIPVFFTYKLRGYANLTLDGKPIQKTVSYYGLEGLVVVPAEGADAIPMLKDPVVEERFGFLYGRFRLEFWWYEINEMVRKLFMGSITMFIAPGSATQILAAIVGNTFFMVMQLFCWPYKTYDDNVLFGIMLVATNFTLFGALLITARIDVLDEYADGVATGVLIGTTVILIVVYCGILIRFQLPYICNWFCPAFIRDSVLNCYRPGGCLGFKMEGDYAMGDLAAKPAPPPKEKAVELDNLKQDGVEMVPLAQPTPDNDDEEDDMDEDELDTLIDTYFHRYDLDESGTLNSNEELQQLSTNLSFKLRLPLTGEEIDEIVASAGHLDNDNCWDLEEFKEWFKDKFVYVDEEDDEEQI